MVYLVVRPVWTDEVNPERWFISLALAVTNVPPNLRPALAPSWEAMLRICVSVGTPIVTTPWALCVTTLLSADWPNVTPVIEDKVAPVTSVPPTVKLPEAVTFVPEIADAVTSPTSILPEVDTLLSEKLITLLVAVISSLLNVNPPTKPEDPILNSPVVLRFSSPKLSAPDEEVIEPLANVISPIIDPVAAWTVPVITELPLTERDVAVIPPDVKLPVVIRSSLPKSIWPEADVSSPVPIVKSPITEPEAAVTVPVVVKLLELNEIPFWPEDAIEPSEIVISPNSPLVVADTVVPEVIPAVASTDPTLTAPLVPMVLAPKLIPPVLELIVPLPKVTLPNLDELPPVIVPVADILPVIVVSPEASVPVVERLLLPNVIPVLSDVIEPSAKVISANFELIGA